jgi:hypothetical protein
VEIPTGSLSRQIGFIYRTPSGSLQEAASSNPVRTTSRSTGKSGRSWLAGDSAGIERELEARLLVDHSDQ